MKTLPRVRTAAQLNSLTDKWDVYVSQDGIQYVRVESVATREQALLRCAFYRAK